MGDCVKIDIIQESLVELHGENIVCISPICYCSDLI